MKETNSLLLPRRNEAPEFGSSSIFFIGNATVLIRYAGFTILTDPNFLHAGDHVHLGEEGRTRLPMYISGDTLIHDRLREIPRRYPDADLALLHLGGTRVLGIMVTMDAEQGMEAMRILDPRTAIPIHYNDYEAFTSPLEDFTRTVSETGLQDKVHYLSYGDTYEFEVPTVRGSA